MQVIGYILSFLWELIMEKNNPDGSGPSKMSKLKRFIVFMILASSLSLNVYIMERLIRISANHVTLVKKLRVLEDEVNQCQVDRKIFETTQRNLEFCMSNSSSR